MAEARRAGAEDLGFRFEVRKGCDVVILYDGRVAAARGLRERDVLTAVAETRLGRGTGTASAGGP